MHTVVKIVRWLLRNAMLQSFSMRPIQRGVMLFLLSKLHFLSDICLVEP
jgi:hypothetical protein